METPVQRSRPGRRSYVAEQPTPLPPAATTPAEIGSLAARALELANRGEAFGYSKVAMGPLPIGEFADICQRLREAPKITAICESCRYRVVKWELSGHRGAIQPFVRPGADTEAGWEPLAWIDMANKGKGRVTTGTGGGDGLGTQNYRCKCGRNIPVKAERRMQLFLSAVAAGRKTAMI